MATNFHVVRRQDAPEFQLPGVRFTGLAAPSRGSHQLCSWLITVAPDLLSAEPHTLDRDEVFMVTSGSLCLQPGSQPLLPGDAAIVPAGTPIQVSNPGGEAATAYVAIAAGFTATAADGTDFETPPWAQ